MRRWWTAGIIRQFVGVVVWLYSGESGIAQPQPRAKNSSDWLDNSLYKGQIAFRQKKLAAIKAPSGTA